MTREPICRFDILLLAMVLSGWLFAGGTPSKAYAGDISLGTVLELGEADRNAVAILGKGVVGRALPARPIADAAHLMPLVPGRWIYRVLTGDPSDQAQEDVMARSRHDKTGKPWRHVVGKQFIEYFRLGSSGNIELVSEVDLEEDVITQYAPTFSVIHEGMSPGETRPLETEIGVYGLHDPTYAKYSGRVKATHTYVGAYEVVVPAGTYPTVLIKSTYKGKVGPASVDDVGYVFYSPGVGIVAAVERSHVSAFFFYDKTTRTPKVLLRREAP